MQFTSDNTNGFDNDELTIMNRVFDELNAANTDIQVKKNLAEKIVNSWTDSMTYEELLGLICVKN